MRALVFRHNLSREAAATIGGRVDQRAYVSRLAPVRIEDIDEPPLPGADWVRVETTCSGMCGSDVKQIVWCRNFRAGNLPVSIHIGNCAAAAGAPADRFAAHPSQLFAIPDDVSDDAAVLADPVSVSLRTILLAPPPDQRPVLVYGSGTLGIAAIALLRHLYPATEVRAATWAGSRAALASRLGAHAVLPSAPEELIAEVARRAGTTPPEPWSKRPWLQDGPAVVYDTIGSAETVETALRLADTGGTLVVSGVEPPRRFGWTPLYFKELHVIGSNGFGVEEVGGVAKHSMEHYFDLIAAGFDLTAVITHRFPLERWQQAVLTLKDARHTGAVKVLLEPGR